MATNTNKREYDIAIYGATGFVGRLVAEYLARSRPQGLTIALAGRSAPRLTELREQLGVAAADWPIHVADASDPQAVAQLASAARVVATTVGPYARYGHELVAACAANGTHYCDLTGEVLFARDCIDRYHETAQSTGARIVNSCGFDSIPSDLGVLLAHQKAVNAGLGPLLDTTLVVRSLKGGFSGGTIDSLRNQLAAVKADRSLARIVVDPYALSPDRSAEPNLGDERDRVKVFKDESLGGWMGPFVMAGYNTRIVRRSNALQDWAYGREFRYREVQGFGNRPKSAAMAASTAAGLTALYAGMSFKATSWAVDKVLPDPGEGPSEESRRNGRFRMEIVATTASGERTSTTVAAQGDPGYAATAVMFSEAASCLAIGDGLPDAAGVLTPATAMGSALISRLQAADFTFD